MTSKIVTERLVVDRYTKALFELAQESQQLKTIWNDFILIDRVLETIPKSRAIIENPFIAADIQLQLLQLIKSNSDMSEVSYKFLSLLVKNRRLCLFYEIKDSLLKALQEFNNELAVTIISSIALDKKQSQEISDILEKSFSKKIIFSSKIDEKILGGVVIKVGSQMIDCSLASKLKRLVNESKESLSALN